MMNHSHRLSMKVPPMSTPIRYFACEELIIYCFYYVYLAFLPSESSFFLPSP